MSSTLLIDLKKLDHNLNAVNAQLEKNVLRMAVIKDNAYGHGLLPIANRLKEKVEWFCVARVDEGVKLREAGIKIPILVFEIPPAGKEELYLSHNLTASIPDLAVFECLKEGTDCHLKFDTGMGRLGIMPADAEQALEKMKQNSHLNYTGIYTHFANADSVNHPHVFEQLKVFKAIRSTFPENLMTHTANSGAIFYYKEAGLQFDAVRPGVCLFGYAPGQVEVPQLQSIAEWKTHLVQVKKIHKGDVAGYGSRWEAPKSGMLGLIPVGYAHGVSRNLSGKFEVGIGNKFFPQVGTISMDYSAVFLDDTYFEAGEEVTLLRSGDLSVRSWAHTLGTIPYEVITGISIEVKREYLD
ncbi:MAG: alanine racemase [Balneolaceae bacterium]